MPGGSARFIIAALRVRVAEARRRREETESAMLYFAYGSNLSRAGMRERCPAAVPLGRGLLRDYGLVFRLWADVAPRRDAVVTGGLWRISPACRAGLDLYEDVADGLYEALMLPVLSEGGAAPVDALVYRMTAAHVTPPEPDYLAVVLEGCRDFGLDEAPIRDAAAAAGYR